MPLEKLLHIEKSTVCGNAEFPQISVEALSVSAEEIIVVDLLVKWSGILPERIRDVHNDHLGSHILSDFYDLLIVLLQDEEWGTVIIIHANTYDYCTSSDMTTILLVKNL